MTGYSLNSYIVRRDAYRLLSLAFSTPRIGSKVDDEPHSSLARLFGEFAEDELVHLVVGLAMANRLHLDHMQALRDNPDELGFRAPEGSCGSIREGDAPQQPLSLRSACNKVIHAQNISWADQPSPRLRLVGCHARGDWTADLELIPFSELTELNFN